MTRIYPILLLLFGLVRLAGAHNGAVAIAVPVEGIAIDGDLSDWPEGMRYYAVDAQYVNAVKTPDDYQGAFRIGYSVAENALYIAAEMQDEAVVSDSAAADFWNAQDGCEVLVGLFHHIEDAPVEHYFIWGDSIRRNKKEQLSHFEVAVQRQAGVHQYEWRLDITRLSGGLVRLEDDFQIGLNLALLDRDPDGSFSYAMWGQRELFKATGLGDVVLNEDHSGRLEGQLKWAGNNQAVNMGKVKVWGNNAAIEFTADEQGAFAVELPQGSYMARLERPRQEEEVKVNIPAGGVQKLNLQAAVPTGTRIDAGRGQGVWKSFSVIDGLAGVSVYAMVQDRDGILWFGAEGGLSRYDGRRFTSFSAKEGLTGTWVNALLEDREGRLWIGSGTQRHPGGVSYYEDGRFVAFTGNDALSSHVVLAIAQDRDGGLWFGTEGGLSRYDGAVTTTYTQADGLGHNNVFDILEDRQGDVWIATYNGLSRYDGEGFVTYRQADGLPGNFIRCLLEDRDGMLWIGTSQGLSRYDGRRFTNYTTEDGLPNNFIMTILQDREGHLWMGTSTGGGIGTLCRYDGTAFTSYTTADGLAFDLVSCALEDLEGNLWFGTGIYGAGGGVSRFAQEEFRSFTTADGLIEGGVSAIGSDKDGHLWFGTGQGLSRYDGNSFTSFGEEDGLTSPGGRLQTDQGGGVWYGSTRFDGYSFIPYDGEMLFEDLPRRLEFIVPGSDYSVVMHDGKLFEPFETIEGLRQLQVRDLLEDRQGRIWIGTWWGGLFCYDGDKVRVFNQRDGLGDDSIGPMMEDRDGNLWFGTHTGGISRYDGNQFETFTVVDGLANNWVTSLYQDRQGRLFFGTRGGGVSLYDGLVFQTLNSLDGIGHDQVHAVHEDAKGVVWFGTDAGVTRYQPRHTPPAIRIDHVIAAGRQVTGDRVQISTDNEYLVFAFSGRSYKTRPGQLAYVYRLRGHDDQWRATRAEEVAYERLPEGQYVFEVKAVNRDLDYSKAPATVSVEVYPPSFAIPVRLEKIHLEDLFASFYGRYSERPLGSLLVTNDAVQPISATLRFLLPELMRRSFEQTLTIPPQSSQRVDLQPQLDAEVLQVHDTRMVQAEVEIEFEQGGQFLSIKEKPEITLYGTGALRWDSVARAAAFITSTDPAVAAFSRLPLVHFEQQLNALGQPGQHLLQAMLLFEALKQHGVRYRTDSNTPYTQASADHALVDYVQYPAQTLHSKAGDCDDLTVLYCALLEHAGIATALVDYPEHIFLLFDTGLERHQAYQLPLDVSQYLLRGNRLWIPVEITRIRDTFHQAWQAGLQQLDQLAPFERRRRLVDTADAWQQYPAAAPVFEGPVELVEPALLEPSFADQYDALKDRIDAYIDDHYLDPLKQTPANDALRQQLIQLYCALQQYDTAIRTAASHLVQGLGDKATTYNQLGVAYFLKGEMDQAALQFQQAVALRPENKELQRNLDRALQKLGLAERPATEMASRENAGKAKGATKDVGVDDFYWLE